MSQRRYSKRRKGSGWSKLLEPGEQILWSGKSRLGQGMDPDNRAVAWIAAIFVFGGAIFVAIGAGSSLPVLGRAMFGLFGAAMIAMSVFLLWLLRQEAVQGRKPVYYALTDRRALIRGWYGLEIWPIGPDTRPEKRRGKPASVVFGQEVEPGDPTDPKFVPGRRDVGFFNIHDADKVLRLVRRIQTAAPAQTENAP